MKLNPIFSGNMVFAANKPILIYGTGKGEAQISFAGITRAVISSEDKWFVEFPAMQYGGPYELSFSCGDEMIHFNNIYVGEVYLFAGQSNMEFKMRESNTPEELYQPEKNLRFFSTDRIEGGDRYTPKDGWIVTEQDNIKDFSAIGYLAGKELARNLDIAIGIIVCYQGASSIESWLPEGTYKRIGIDLADDEKHPGRFYKEPLPWHHPGVLYHLSLFPVFPFSISAVVWYQGESNTAPKEGKCYLTALTEFVRICRNNFNDPKLPFIVVQIADYKARNDEGWRAVQSAQDEAQRILPHTKTVISADVCENDDIHPKTKHHLAKRIADALETLIV